MEIISEITEDVGNGVTDPIRGYIDDKKVVAKYIHNNEGFIALFNELLGYNLAEFFGIRHPHFGYALFSKEDTAVKNGKDYVHSSLFTYTTWLEKSLTITSPSMTSFVQKSEIVNLLLFDIFIYNKDRNLGNLLIEIPKKLYPIDYTHILPGGCIWPDVLKNDDYSIEDLIKDMFSSGYYQYLLENRKIETSIIEDCGRTFVDKVNDVDIESIISKIPIYLKNNLSEENIQQLYKYFIYITENFDEAIKFIIEKIGKE